MNKLFTGLLIAAAGAGIFFLLRKKKDAAPVTRNKEWIIGKWKSADAQDTNFSKYTYDFVENGTIIQSRNDSSAADTSYYQWNKTNELRWKENVIDTTGKTFAILKLTKDSLLLQKSDSSMVLFIK